jgi:hypothetical protein
MFSVLSSSYKRGDDVASSVSSTHSGKQLALLLLGPADCWPHGWPGLTDNENGGKMLHLHSGRLISYDYVTKPFVLYGKIFDFWNNLGAV